MSVFMGRECLVTPTQGGRAPSQLFSPERLVLALQVVAHMRDEGWVPFWCHHCDRHHALLVGQADPRFPHGPSPAMAAGLLLLGPEIDAVVEMEQGVRS